MSTTTDQWHLDCYSSYLKNRQLQNNLNGMSPDRRYKLKDYSNMSSSFSSADNLYSQSTASRNSGSKNQQHRVNLTKVQKVSYSNLNVSGGLGHMELDVEEEDDLMMLLDGIA